MNAQDILNVLARAGDQAIAIGYDRSVFTLDFHAKAQGVPTARFTIAPERKD